MRRGAGAERLAIRGRSPSVRERVAAARSDGTNPLHSTCRIYHCQKKKTSVGDLPAHMVESSEHDEV